MTCLEKEPFGGFKSEYEIFDARGKQNGRDLADWLRAERDTRGHLRVTENAASLTCAVLGHLNGKEPRIGGSGVFVAPGLAITARHVVRDLFRTDPERADDLLARAPGLVQMPHNCALFQMTDATKDSAPAATWAVTGTWDGRPGAPYATGTTRFPARRPQRVH